MLKIDILCPGRCAVCCVQRKGICGTITAPKKCLRRIALTATGRQVPTVAPPLKPHRPLSNVLKWVEAQGEGRDGSPQEDVTEASTPFPPSHPLTHNTFVVWEMILCHTLLSTPAIC